MSKIIGITVGTPLSPQAIKEKLKPVTSINGVGADEQGDVALPDYVAADELPQAINIALAQAKESGEFNGKDGKDGDDGYTPIKGTDYYTDDDKTEMVNAVIASLPVYGGETE